jgi:hypothetical protein
VIPKDGRGGGSLERDVVGGTADGLTDKVETELYARYYVFLEESWGSTVDSKQDARLGWAVRFLESTRVLECDHRQRRRTTER